jgi:catechol 2,3-dioxygenase-like lactoylglutathione lyase family enzyme
MMDYLLQVVMVPVRDVDRSRAFYEDACGFNVDVDYEPNDGFRVVQLTPSGSACSVQIGVGITDAEPGTARNLCLVVSDLESARRELLDRGVAVDAIRHKTSIEDWQGDLTEGLDSERRNYASFASFADPDGNTWSLQEIGFQSPGSNAQS